MVFSIIYNLIKEANFPKKGETLIIGIGGNTGSGKSNFAQEFSEFLNEKGISTLLHENDFYQGPRSEKVRKRKQLIEEGADRKDDWWKVVGEEIYYNSYDRDLMEKHLISLKSRQDISAVNLYNKQSGEWDKPISYQFSDFKNPLWILHDGVYLFHPQVRNHLDKVVILQTGEEELVSHPELGEISKERLVRFERVAQRGLERGYKVNFYSGFLPLDIQTAKHIRDGLAKEEDPIIVDNSDFTKRRILSRLPSTI